MGKITSYASATPAAADVLIFVDVDDLSMAPSGTDKQVTVSNLMGALQPWQFYVRAYGAKGDGKIVTDGVMTNGSANLACATSLPFTSTAVDGGKSVLVSTAKGAYVHLAGTISSVTDTGHAVLSAAATANTGGTPGAITYFGTDDTAAINAAKAAAVAYAQANNGYAEIIFDPLIYIIAGAPVIGGATAGNAQIPLPIIATTAQKVTLVFKGGTDATAVLHWQQTTPQASGTVLACARVDGTNDVNNGPSSVIGGPFNGYGAAGAVFNNLLPVIQGITILVPYNSTYCGFDFFGCAEAVAPTSSAIAAGVVPSASAPAPTLSSQSNISNQYTFGLRMPATNNNDNSTVGSFSSEGLCYGFMPSEHTVAESIRALYCIIGVEAFSNMAGVGMTHGIRIKYASVEACAQGVGYFDANPRLDIDTLDVESLANVVYDPNNRGQGTIGYRGDTANSGYQLSTIINGGAGVRLINLSQPSGPVAAPAAPPANNAAWVNAYYRDAWITLSATTITALKIDAVAQNGLAGSPATYTFLLPAGHSYTPTYTGVLTHTVTLL